VERTQREMQAHVINGAPGLVQAIHQAALAIEAEGWHDVAGLLRGWAKRVEKQEARRDPRRPEVWLG